MMKFLAALLVASTVCAQQPNIVLIITDDQRWDTIEYMPNVQHHFVDNGIQFTNGFVTTSLCCPSRSSVLTGQYAHNHGVLTNQNSDIGGFQAFDDSETIAVWLDRVGYRTGFFGKYLNGYTSGTYVPPGWDDWRATIGTNNEEYYNFSLNENGSTVSYGSGEANYQTDVFGKKALSFIRAYNGTPFFVYFAPRAPHKPATPAARHANMFSNLPLHRPPNYNEADVSDKPAWVRSLSLLSSAQQSEFDQFRLDQIRSLQAVDEYVDSLIAAVTAIGQLNNTIFIYIGDNGYLWGEHRVNDKNYAYEEAIRVPILVKKSGLTARTDDRFVLNIDLAPTIAEYGGASAVIPSDGKSLVPVILNTATSWRTDFLLEHWDKTNATLGFNIPQHNGVRTADGFKYVEIGSETELYDLNNDPFELQSQHNNAAYSAIKAQLAARLSVLEVSQGCSVAPTSNFIAAPVSGGAPLSVSFTDQSTGGATAWSWNFGDGATSTEKNPVHVYSAVGLYNVSLSTANDCGSNTLTRSNYITVSAATSNLALNKVATASSVYSTTYAATKANDGSTSTYWRSKSVSSSTVVWWRVDLGAAQSVNRFVIKWRSTYYAKQYDVQVSNDDVSWATVYTDNLGNGGTDDVTFTATTARYVRVYMRQNNTSSERINEVEVYGAGAAMVKPSDENVQSELTLENHPNPFNPSTEFRFYLPLSGRVKLAVYNTLGQEVVVLIDEYRIAGQHAFRYDFSRLPSGIYYARLQAGGKEILRKLAFTK